MSNSLSTILTILSILWSTLLTIALMALIRQVGVLTVRLSLAKTGIDFSVDDDGPVIGSKVPDEVLQNLPQLVDIKPSYLVLISSTCGSCRDLATQLRQHTFNNSVTVLVAGREELAQGLIKLLPNSFNIIQDPDALTIAHTLNIQSTPFAVRIEGGIITKKAYLHKDIDLILLMESDNSSYLSNNNHMQQEVSHVN